MKTILNNIHHEIVICLLVVCIILSLMSSSAYDAHTTTSVNISWFVLCYVIFAFKARGEPKQANVSGEEVIHANSNHRY